VVESLGMEKKILETRTGGRMNVQQIILLVINLHVGGNDSIRIVGKMYDVFPAMKNKGNLQTSPIVRKTGRILRYVKGQSLLGKVGNDQKQQTDDL
jgi:hypothetical protein